MIIGRNREKKLFGDILNKERASFVAVYGRRRVGKTYLIREYFKDEICFTLSGAYHQSFAEQLQNFHTQYIIYTQDGSIPFPPENWSKAFERLVNFIRSLPTTQKKVVFLDELPWLDSPRSGFMSALEYAWNQHFSAMLGLTLVVCGSAASWMMDNLINAKGGLYNRVTHRIHLKPFSLQETALYCKEKNVQLTQYQLIQLYMVMGGIPFYLNEISRGKSVHQLIDDICFTPNGLLSNEYGQLLRSLFNKAENHRSIVEALAAKPRGLTRSELVKNSGVPDGGSFSRALYDLEYSGFIRSQPPYGKNVKGTIYILEDFYTLFYLKFIKGNVSDRPNTWQNLSQTSAYRAWSGYAFENVCFAHLDQVHQKLGITGVFTETSSWVFKGNQEMPGAQVDLLIHRADGIIHLCEAKFSTREFVVTKNYIQQLRQKRAAFTYKEKPKGLVVTTLFTTYPAIQNSYYLEEVHTEVTMEDLFL